MIADPFFYLLAVPALLIAGIGKGGFGSGGIAAVPAMALAVPVPQAAAIALPVLILMDLVGVWTYWNRWDARLMAVLLPAALLGIVIGTATFSLLPDNALKLLLGAIAIVFVLEHWLGGRDRTADRPDLRKGWFWGTVSGYTSFVAHSGGPPLNIFLLPLKLEKTTMVATSVVFFAVANYAKLAPYWWLGQLTAGNLETALVLSPLAPAGMLTGAWLLKRIGQTAFLRVCYGLVLVTGLKLAWDGSAWLLR